MAEDKFLQPADGIEVAHTGSGKTLLTPEAFQRALDKIAAGGDRDKIVTELAQELVELEDGLREDGLLPEAIIPDDVFRGLGDVEGHPFHGNQWTEGQGGIEGASKLNAGHHIDARKIAHVSKALLQGQDAESAAVDAGATDAHVGAAKSLVNATRQASEHQTVLYRGVGAEDPIPDLENLKVGDTVSLGQLTSFSESQLFAAYYANRASDLVGHTYELKTTGAIKSVPTDVHTGLSHKEHLTQGKFKVVSIDEPRTGVSVLVDKTVTGNRKFYVHHNRSITLKQEGVF